MGTLTGVARVAQGENREWSVAVTPAGSGDVTVTLAATADCAAAGAICTGDGRALSAAVPETAPETAPVQQQQRQQQEPAFTVRFEGVPAEHDGTDWIVFKVLFNKRPESDYGYETMRDSTLKVRQGEASFGASHVRRLNRPHNDRWEVTVRPASKADLTVTVGAGRVVQRHGRGVHG